MQTEINVKAENSPQDAITGLKINVGCGGAWHVEGWIGIDQKTTSAVWQKSDMPQFIDLNVKHGLPFPTNSLDVVFSSHTLEHFTYEEGTALLFEIYRVLKIGAPLCLVVPDMDLYLSNYLNRDNEFLTTPEIIGGVPKGNLADNFLMNFYSDPSFNNTCHKYSYNFENLSSRLRLIGFDEIQRVGFHEFTYWPELKDAKFRSPIPHIERFSLCVQCRKTSFDPDYRGRPEYQEAQKYSRFRETESELAQQLNTTLIINSNLNAQLLESSRERDRLQSSFLQQGHELEVLRNELAARARNEAQLIQEHEQSREALGQATAQIADLNDRHQALQTELAAAKIKRQKLIRKLKRWSLSRKQANLQLRYAADQISHLQAELQHKSEFYPQRLQELQSTLGHTKLSLEASLSTLDRITNLNARSVRWLAERLARSLAKLPLEMKREAQEYSLISSSGLFDRSWYLRHNLDVAKAEIDPIRHYIHRGAFEGRNPNSWFDSNWYLTQYADIAQAGLNPLAHYIRYGVVEGRLPHPDWKHKFKMPVSVGPETQAKVIELPKADPGLDIPVADENMRKIINLSNRSNGQPATVSSTLYSPQISILIPTYNTPPRFLKEVVQSVLQQTYTAWELCIVDDGSTDENCLKVLHELAGSDPRIRVAFSESNGGIAEASQRALEMAAGEFVAFVDHDDVLAVNALSEVVHCLREHPEIDMIYTDHAMMNEEGVLTSAALKPDWSPEFFLCTNYIVHFKVLRRSLVNQVGGFGDTIAVAQDIALSCKIAETSAKIWHLRKALYYWRLHQGSVSMGTSAKPEIERAAIQTYNNFLKRRNVAARLAWPEYFRSRRIGVYKLDFSQQPKPRMAVVVPVRGETENLLSLCADLTKSGLDTAQDLHIVSLRKGLEFPAHLLCRSYYAETQSDFDEVIEQINSEVLVFIPPGTAMVTRNWLEELVGYLSVSSQIGAVGGKVLNQHLRVVDGGALLMNTVVPICKGHLDASDGHWYRGRIASNVEVVSSRLMATRKDLYQQAGGLPVFDYLDMAGTPYCLKLRSLNYRVVFNPWSKIIDTAASQIPENFDDRLKQNFGDIAKLERYYHPFFSREAPYTLRD